MCCMGLRAINDDICNFTGLQRFGKLNFIEKCTTALQHEKRVAICRPMTNLVGSSPDGSKGSIPARPLIFASSQLVFSCSSPPNAIVYLLEPSSSAFAAYVVVTCTSDPPSSTVRTIAVFSKDFEDANTDVMEIRRRNGSVLQLEGDMVEGRWTEM